MANIHLNKQWPITTSLLVTSLMLLGMFALLPLNVHAQSSTSQVTVTSQDTNGNTITGYWTVLYDSSGSVAGSGYTPATFGTNSGHTYTLEADSYGSCTFDHWSTGSTADPMTITATSSDQTFTAVYNCGTGVGGGSSSSVTVKSVDQNNNPITGYYTILYDSSGNVLGNGYTSHTFATTSGQTYAVEADGYGSCLFDHWSSSGSTADPMSFTATSAAQTFTAVYNCGGGGSGGGGGSSSTLIINSIDQNGNTITGYFVTLYGSGGSTVGTGYTSATFTTSAGLAYNVQVDNYGGCSFNNWSGGSNANPMTFTATTSPQTFTAVYSCGGGHPNGITLFDHRIPASYWQDCFATQCTNPLDPSCGNSCSGPGASMWFEIATDQNMNHVVATGFADENGKTITGLTPGVTYYISPANCDLCHGSTHDVLFQYWGTSQGAQINSTNPLPITVGETVNAWYSCTNGCGGG